MIISDASLDRKRTGEAEIAVALTDAEGRGEENDAGNGAQERGPTGYGMQALAKKHDCSHSTAHSHAFNSGHVEHVIMQLNAQCLIVLGRARIAKGEKEEEGRGRGGASNNSVGGACFTSYLVKKISLSRCTTANGRTTTQLQGISLFPKLFSGRTKKRERTGGERKEEGTV